MSRQADFYGAMDGAAKFVRGDAIAGLLITAINILGGVFIGMVQRGLPFSRAASQYTMLTVGDGLVSQIPALVVSTAAGVMVTYSAGGTRLGSAIVAQVERQPRAMDGLRLPRLARRRARPADLAFPRSRRHGRRGRVQCGPAQRGARAAQVTAAQEVKSVPVPAETAVQDLLQVDPVELEVGYGLIQLVDERHGGDLLERIRLLRKQAALDLGILIPRIRIRDDMRLPPNDYVVRIRGSEVVKAKSCHAWCSRWTRAASSVRSTAFPRRTRASACQVCGSRRRRRSGPRRAATSSSMRRRSCRHT